MFLINYDLSEISGDGLKRFIESELEPIMKGYVLAYKIAQNTYMTKSNDNFNTPSSIASMILHEFANHFDQDGLNILNILKSIKLTVCRIQQDSNGNPMILNDEDRKNVLSELKDYFE